VAFLDDAAEEKRAIEMAKQEEIQKEMKRFKELSNGRMIVTTKKTYPFSIYDEFSKSH
jgi:hypothetical protein